eukprot:sb/3473364/
MVTQGHDPEVESYDDDYLPREMMMMSGDSTADLLYQHEAAAAAGYPPGYHPGMDGGPGYHAGMEGAPGYHPGMEGAPGYHPGMEGAPGYHPDYYGFNDHPDYGTGMVSPQPDDEEDDDHLYAAPPHYPTNYPSNYPSNLDQFSKTLENWHLR